VNPLYLEQPCLTAHEVIGGIIVRRLKIKDLTYLFRLSLVEPPHRYVQAATGMGVAQISTLCFTQDCTLKARCGGDYIDYTNLQFPILTIRLLGSIAHTCDEQMHR
jgi:hypothetical protein